MTDKQDVLAEALRKLRKRWMVLSAIGDSNVTPSRMLQECAAQLEEILATHESARAQPASVADELLTFVREVAIGAYKPLEAQKRALAICKGYASQPETAQEGEG
jgi:hypothetical protein